MVGRAEAETVVNALLAAVAEGHTAMYDNEQGEFAGWLGVPATLIALGLAGVDVGEIDAFVAWWPRPYSEGPACGAAGGEKGAVA